MAIEEIIKDLNLEQQKAVTFGNGPFLIIAGAGTGKTTVITRRIAWLILSGLANPEEILAVTFTDKASEEMETRVDQLLPYGYVDLWVSTFHSFCERVLRQHSLDIGLPMNFKILNTTQQVLLVRQNFDRFNLDYYRPLGNPYRFIRDLVRHFSRAKDEAISPEEYLLQAEKKLLNHDSVTTNQAIDQETARLKEIAEAYHTYQQLLLENSALDFGDLINYTIKLFKERPNVLAKYRQQFKYVLVDEFQDTNWAQYELLKILAAPNNNFTVVADDDQSIYKFRGASYNNVIQFKRDFPSAQQVVLIKNYRSKQEILDLAYQFIQLNNPNRLEAQFIGSENNQSGGISKKLEALRGRGGQIQLLKYNNQDEEAMKVVEEIIKIKEGENSLIWSDIAILVRANSQAEIFCQALKRKNIPYQFLASTGLFTKSIILDVLAYLKLLVNYHESPSVYRLLTSPLFELQLSNDDLVAINYWASRKGKSLYQALKTINGLPGISKQGLEVSQRLLGWIDKHSQLARQQSIGKIVFSFLEDSGYLKLVSQKAEHGDSESIENIQWLSQFFDKIDEFEKTYADKSLKNFLETMQVIVESGDEGSLTSDFFSFGPEAVKILTVHGAKGLEFKHVFIVNLVDRRFPTNERHEGIELPIELIKEIIPEGDIHLQEERRLFYVAMTRAKDGLYFSLASDYGGARRKKPSRFLYELGLLNKEELLSGPVSSAPKLPFFSDSINHPINLKPPVKISFSQLRAFENCPLQYKFAFILKVPVRGRYVYSFGQTIHLTLHNFLSKFIDRQKTNQSQLFVFNQTKDSQNILSLDDLLNIYSQAWIDDWYLNENLQQEYKKLGLKVLQKFYDDWSVQPPKIHALELDFNLKLTHCTLKGKVDRVDRVEGGLEIIDYKTGKPKSSGKISTEDKEQLLIYQMAVGELFSEPIKNLTYYYLEDGTRLSFLGQDFELEQLRTKIDQIFQQIQQGLFPPRPGLLCQHCDFKDICEYRKL